MRMWQKPVVVCLASLIGFLGAEKSSRAVEPADNTAPWSLPSLRGNVSTYLCANTGCGWGSIESISSTTDVDYHMMVCGYGVLTRIWITFNGAAGDLDIEIYKPHGSLLGRSSGIGDTEQLDVSGFNRNALVLEVYGYRGAMNPYTIGMDCTTP